MRKICWLDLETGGLDPVTTDVTEIAGVIEIDGVVAEEFELLVSPSMAQRVTPEALQVQGKTVEQVMAHPVGQRQAWRQLKEILGRHVDQYDKEDKFVWAGQNPTFDQAFLKHLWKVQGDKYFHSWFHYAPVDLCTLVRVLQLRGHLAGLANVKLTTVAAALGVDLQAHRALNDIRATRECFHKLLRLVPEAM